jgi:hypothetical protein
LGSRANVRRRKPDAAPAPGAVHDASANDMGTTEKLGGQGDVTVGDRPPNDRRAHDHAVDRDRVNHLDRKIETNPGRDQRIDVPLTAASEVQIVTDEDLLRVEDLDEKASHEIVGFDLGEAHRERLHDRGIEAVHRERGEAIAEPHEALGRRLRAQHGDGMRLEGERERGDSAVVGIGSDLIENDRVTAVYTIEVTDGHDGARETPASALETANDPQVCAGREGLSSLNPHLLKHPVAGRLRRAGVSIDEFLQAQSRIDLVADLRNTCASLSNAGAARSPEPAQHDLVELLIAFEHASRAGFTDPAARRRRRPTSSYCE